MEKERDVRLVRFDLRLRVGADGDPFDNELHNAWAALPENTVIRNDWLRRRLLLGHILERDGLTELLSVIGRLAPAVAHEAIGRDQRPAVPQMQAPLKTAAADFLPPEPDAPPAPAAPPKASARQQLGGLLPTIEPAREESDEEKTVPRENKTDERSEKTSVARTPASREAHGQEQRSSTKAADRPKPSDDQA